MDSKLELNWITAALLYTSPPVWPTGLPPTSSFPTNVQVA